MPIMVLNKCEGNFTMAILFKYIGLILCFQKYNYFSFFFMLNLHDFFSLLHFFFCSSRVIFRSFIFIGVLISDFVYTHT